MLTCKEIAQLVSDALDRELPWYQRLMVHFHLLYCKACRRYRRQIRFLREAMQRYEATLASLDASALPALDPAARERIKRDLDRH